MHWVLLLAIPEGSVQSGDGTVATPASIVLQHHTFVTVAAIVERSEP